MEPIEINESGTRETPLGSPLLRPAEVISEEFPFGSSSMPSTSSTHYGDVPMRIFSNLDKFFIRVYEYYNGGGFGMILLSRFLAISSLAFVLLLFTFVANFVNLKVLISSHSLVDSFRGADGFLSFNPVIVLLFVYFLYFLVLLGRTIYIIPGLIEMRQFFRGPLNLKSLDAVRWEDVVSELRNLQERSRFITNRRREVPLSEFEISARILRKDHVLMAILKNDIVSSHIPILGGKFSTYTTTFEWNIRVAVLSFVFDNQNSIRAGFMAASSPGDVSSSLVRRFYIIGFLNVVFSPFILLFMVGYFFFRHGDEVKSNPELLGARQWSPLAKMKFREYGEVEHVFQSRMKRAYPLAVLYTRQFPSRSSAIWGKFLTVVIGSMVAVVALFTVVDSSSLTELHIAGYALVFWSGLLMSGWAAARAMIPDTTIVSDPIECMKDLMRVVHLLPRAWKNTGNRRAVREEFASECFIPKQWLLLSHIVSVIINPYHLFFTLPRSAPSIVDFIRNSFVHDDLIGWSHSRATPEAIYNRRKEIESLNTIACQTIDNDNILPVDTHHHPVSSNQSSMYATSSLLSATSAAALNRKNVAINNAAAIDNLPFGDSGEIQDGDIFVRGLSSRDGGVSSGLTNTSSSNSFGNNSLVVAFPPPPHSVSSSSNEGQFMTGNDTAV